MKYLIVGLGNIGPKYAFTRHNVGFMALDRLAAEEGLNFSMEKLAYHTEWKFKGRKVHLIKPTTFMNLSGKALQYWMNTQKIPKENVLVLVDDLALPIGKLRLKPKGSSAGHNGLKDIERVLQDSEYARLKIGIGNNYPKGRQVDYVLGEFPEDDMILMMNKFDKVKEMISSFCFVGVNKTMNSFNE
ncbi:aminoacyl-tRNA hydrolase [Arcticibacterium luteifluviistationis]|uniref:Peptidyl-tRNA hydrolase n=1 Tax=Arcticibacterium luteifluviistationis TaxID=1784714 RepID=A0A2Z4GID0_9BACT|nr:aminoacyl-tRNA hydrolase [Arcticibacterium luteifluviistationis]AWW00736.1 aminoacyl-tRNA hydrolase [Arcticibacterium luteifluviistationis]